MNEIANYFTASTYSPYGMCKIVNKILHDIDSEIKELPAPMFYTYVKKGFIPSENKVVTREHAIEWTVKYLTKRFGITEAPSTVEAVNMNEINEALEQFAAE